MTYRFYLSFADNGVAMVLDDASRFVKAFFSGLSVMGNFAIHW